VKGRYLGILAVSLGLAVALTVWGRSIGGRVRQTETPVSSADTRPIEVVLRIEPDGTMTPASVSVEKGKRVHVTVTNHGEDPARVGLPGYEDAVASVSIEAGETWCTQFTADRPGEDFAWVLNGAPATRFLVTGSHLIEGHQ